MATLFHSASTTAPLPKEHLSYVATLAFDLLYLKKPTKAQTLGHLHHPCQQKGLIKRSKPGTSMNIIVPADSLRHRNPQGTGSMATAYLLPRGMLSIRIKGPHQNPQPLVPKAQQDLAYNKK